MSITGANGFRGVGGSQWPRRRRLWRARSLAPSNGAGGTVGACLKDPDARAVPPLAGAGKTRATFGPVPGPTQTGEQRSGLHSPMLRWLVVGFLAAVVFVNLVRPSPLCYLLVAVGLPFAFLSPATALATYILTCLVPNAFGENDVAAHIQELLLIPMAYHAFKSRVPKGQPWRRAFLLLQGILCLTVLVLALASETPSEMADLLPEYVGPCVLLLAAAQRWTMSDRRFLFSVLALAGALVAVKTNLRFASHTHAAGGSEDVMRATFDQLDPNYMACYIGFGLVCALYLMTEALNSRHRQWMALVWLAPIAVSLVAMGSLASRGITIALVAGFAVLVAAAPAKMPARVSVLLLVLMAGFVLAMAGHFDLLWARFLKDDVATGNNRVEINAVALRLFAERPWYEKFFGGGGSSSLRAMGWHTHNAFTEQLLDHGILGGCCFVGLFLCLGAAGARGKGGIRASGLVLLCFTAVASLSVSPFRFAWGWVALACILPCWQPGGPSAAGPPRRQRA